MKPRFVHMGLDDVVGVFSRRLGATICRVDRAAVWEVGNCILVALYSSPDLTEVDLDEYRGFADEAARRTWYALGAELREIGKTTVWEIDDNQTAAWADEAFGWAWGTDSVRRLAARTDEDLKDEVRTAFLRLRVGVEEYRRAVQALGRDMEIDDAKLWKEAEESCQWLYEQREWARRELPRREALAHKTPAEAAEEYLARCVLGAFGERSGMNKRTLVVPTSAGILVAWLEKHASRLLARAFVPTPSGHAGLKSSYQRNGVGQWELLTNLTVYGKDGAAQLYEVDGLLLDLISLASERVEVVIQCKTPYALEYFHELLTDIYRTWPGTTGDPVGNPAPSAAEAPIVAVPIEGQAAPDADTTMGTTPTLPPIETMKGFYADYSSVTAREILDALKAAYADYDRDGGRWGPGVIGKRVGINATTVGRYLKAFRAAGLTEWDGTPLPD